ncbi:MAG: glycosyltransferase [Gammaproteobacteria bacterium]|nr:MAG: glycosyltransferase [Gammaproteobacteria bacterium]
MHMSDVHTATSHRSGQTAERDGAPLAMSSVWGDAAARARDLPLTPGVAQVLQSRTDRDPRLSSAETCESAHLKRILVYSHDTFGLGNIKRMLEISKHLVATYSDVSVLIISGSPMVHAFRISPRIDYIKLPCLTRTLDGAYDVKFLGLDYDDTIRLRATLITNALLDFAPDLILVDKKPFGVSNELAPGLRLLHGRGALPKVVLLLRDILDDPETTTATWERNHYHEAVRSFYDRILVVGSPEIFNLATEYKFPASSGSKVQFCGYLRRDRGSQTREQIRGELGVHDEHLVLVTGGGGEDGYQLLANYVHGLSHLPRGTKIRTLLICGPEMSEQNRRRIRLGAAHPGLVIQEFNNDMMGCIDAADLVVSMAGYNTICEILSLRKRAIVVPRVRPVQEQWMRAERMAKLGLLRAIHPDHVTPMKLMRAVIEELNADDGGSQKAYNVDLDGMSRVVSSLYALLDDSAPIAATSMA